MLIIIPIIMIKSQLYLKFKSKIIKNVIHVITYNYFNMVGIKFKTINS